MNKTYGNLFQLLEQDSKACQYFNRLPEPVREQICQRATGVNSFESLCSYADKLTRGDD